MDIIEVYKVSRSQIEHIDNTISQRINWLVISQSFFFSGVAILITGVPKELIMIERQSQLLLLFPISAIVMCIISLVDIIMGILYQEKLNNFFDAKNKLESAELIFPPLFGFNNLNRLKNWGSFIVPITFIIIWIIVLTIKL